MVESQAQSWCERVRRLVSASRADRGERRAPPAEDKAVGWRCRVIRLLNEHLGSLVRTQPLVRHDYLGLEECPYARRWTVDLGRWSLRVHYWLASDHAAHDHPHDFLTFVVWGAYVDVSSAGRDLVAAPAVRFRRAEHRHRVEVLVPGTVSLVVTGPARRRWGFWVDGRRVPRDKYFARYGHHPCDPSQPPVRVAPDGRRLA